MKSMTCLLPFLLVGCIHAPQARHLMGAPMGALPPSPAHVQACEKTRMWHNIWTLSGMVLGGASGAGAGLAAGVSDKPAQTGIEVTAVASGILAAVATGAAGIEADVYATNDCVAVLQAAANASYVEPTPAVSPTPAPIPVTSP